jgi:hypothetical protein
LTGAAVVLLIASADGLSDGNAAPRFLLALYQNKCWHSQMQAAMAALLVQSQSVVVLKMILDM